MYTTEKMLLMHIVLRIFSGSIITSCPVTLFVQANGSATSEERSAMSPGYESTTHCKDRLRDLGIKKGLLYLITAAWMPQAVYGLLSLSYKEHFVNKTFG